MLALLGCGEQPKRDSDTPIVKAPALDSPKASPARPAGSKPRDVSLAGFQFSVPANWEEQPPKSQFVLAEFSISGEGGAARLTLSSAGGGIEANVERWRGQFLRGPNDPEPRESEITFDGKKGTLVELAGTYTDMFGGGSPTKGWRMLGIAVPLGETNYFVKLTGPAATVDPRRDQFLQFIESARMEK